jgi:hypothetical protein
MKRNQNPAAATVRDRDAGCPEQEHSGAAERIQTFGGRQEHSVAGHGAVTMWGRHCRKNRHSRHRLCGEREHIETPSPSRRSQPQNRPRRPTHPQKERLHGESVCLSRESDRNCVLQAAAGQLTQVLMTAPILAKRPRNVDGTKDQETPPPRSQHAKWKEDDPAVRSNCPRGGPCEGIGRVRGRDR